MQLRREAVQRNAARRLIPKFYKGSFFTTQMSQERQISLFKWGHASGDYVGIGLAPDGDRIMALYAETRMRPLEGRLLTERPAAVSSDISDTYDQGRNIRIVNGNVAVGNGEHLDLLVQALARADRPNPLHTFGEWVYGGGPLALPKTAEEKASEAHPHDRKYTARLAAVLTPSGSAMFALWERHRHVAPELVGMPAEPGKLRITSSYTNNMFLPGDYISHSITQHTAEEAALHLVQYFPPVNALSRQVTLLFYDFAQRKGTLAQATAATTTREAISVNAMEVITAANTRMAGVAQISPRYGQPLSQTVDTTLSRKK